MSSNNIEDISYISPLIKEYEDLIKSLQLQLDYYLVEQNGLKRHLSEVTEENQSLSLKLKEALKQISDTRRNIPSQLAKDKDLVSNLQQQLALTVQEKDSARELCEIAKCQVEKLEEENRLLKKGKSFDVSSKVFENVKEEYSQAIVLLESSLESVKEELNVEKDKYSALEKELLISQQEQQGMSIRMEIIEKDMVSLLQKNNAFYEKLKCVEKDKALLDTENRRNEASCKELEKALSKCHEQMDCLIERDSIARQKVQESLIVIESAVGERDAAIQKEKIVKEKNKELQKALNDLIKEAGKKVREESEKLKKTCNNQIQLLLGDMKNLKMVNREKSEQYEKSRRDLHLAQDEIERLKAQICALSSSESIFQDHKLEALYRTIALTEQKLLAVETNRDKLQAEIVQLKQSHKLVLQQKDNECKTLEEKLGAVERDLEKCLCEHQQSLSHINKLQDHMTLVEEVLQKPHKCSNDTCLQVRKNYNVLLQEFNSMKTSSHNITQELERHIESQTLIKHKWQEAIMTITNKFESRFLELKRKTIVLQKENQELKKKYKAHSYNIRETIYQNKEI